MFSDKMTIIMKRIAYAKICAEVSVETEIPEVIEIISGEDTFY